MKHVQGLVLTFALVFWGCAESPQHEEATRARAQPLELGAATELASAGGLGRQLAVSGNTLLAAAEIPHAFEHTSSGWLELALPTNCD